MRFPMVEVARKLWAVALACAALAGPAASPEDSALRYVIVGPDVVEQRLRAFAGTDLQREATLKGFFETAGCTGDSLREQPVVVTAKGARCLAANQSSQGAWFNRPGSLAGLSGRIRKSHIHERAMVSPRGKVVVPPLHHLIRGERRHILKGCKVGSPFPVDCL